MASWTPGSGILHYNATAESLSSSQKLSCSTNGSSCNISSLHCGESYKVSVNGQGRNCESPARYWYTVNTAPCPPTLKTVNSSCQSNNITVSWEVSQGSVTYMAVAKDSEGHKMSCNTSTTTCQITGLLCGQHYEVYVVGVNKNCVGSKSTSQMIQTAPCVPQHVHHHLDCSSGDLNITWESSGYAVYFHTTVQSTSADIKTCKTAEHHCVIPRMQCGLTYNVTVLAHDGVCNSSRSATLQVTTVRLEFDIMLVLTVISSFTHLPSLSAPCPPMSFQPTVNCLTGVVSVTWQDRMAGVLYMVSAVNSSGQVHNCSSSTANSCNLSTLECGTEYSVTITPSRDGCVGRTSPPKTFKSSPCVPHLTGVEIDCLTNSAWVMWEESAPAEGYVVLATKDGLSSSNATYSFYCNTTEDRVCDLPPLKCGENLTFTLQARNGYCTSVPSNAVKTETAPCPPETIEHAVACENGTVEMSWSASPGAVTYTATLEKSNGDHTCCTTSDTSCKLTDLPCGTAYVLLVIAEGRTCNSTPSWGILVETEPCVPEELKVSLSCITNVASMSWNYSARGLNYHVMAVSDNGHTDECSSPFNRCDLRGLQCGRYYNATVVAKGFRCTTKPSDSVSIKTVPCTPANFSSVTDCEAGSLVISWRESSGADSYLATVHDSIGLSTTCLATTQGFCSVLGIHCGQIYHTTLVSSDGYCDSPPTPVMDTHSVPCVPTHIAAGMDCSMKTAIVSWFRSEGALSYLVTATAASGHTATCKVNTTHCELVALLCGQSYSISVMALAMNCSSIAHMSGQLLTEPCIPQYIVTQYSVGIGQVMWDASAGAQYYTVEGQTLQGLMTSCMTNNTNCALYNMACGQKYIINVTANNNVCKDVSTSSESVVIETEPCPPTNVETSVACQGSMATVSWEGSHVAVGYSVSLSGRDGHSLSCYSTDTFCTVKDLHCGTIYYTSVVAVGKTLNSTSSTTVSLTSAPCGVENVKVDVDCNNDTAHVSWSSADGANSYWVTATGSAGHWTLCDTNTNSCYLTDLQCGQTYNVSLTVISKDCQTEMHTNTSFSTRPCQPMHVGVDLKCGSSTANLYWEEKEMELYVATATYSTGTTLQCNSTNSTCQFSHLECGETYTFSVTAHSDTCQSAVSSSVEIQTEPCQPLGITVNGSCDSETVFLDWMEAKGAKMYVVSAIGNLGYITALQTNDTMAELELPCGQIFTFTVKSQDDQCDSHLSLPKDFKTGPCVPQHVRRYTHCEDSKGSVSWAVSDGAEYYLAFAEAEDGHIHTTMCTPELDLISELLYKG
ncbi:fibronectin type III domain-containing protein 7 [Thalassophryne amazonica]|uniref:fibronectin type III domain-containing protein 7 n=1 Tax=Thalassophryne amazonica TaxID=390379 RepID=UPI001470E85B|nr:fibronectin type III domain-containing protein 7 [Thalassophryne amazonica]